MVRALPSKPEAHDNPKGVPYSREDLMDVFNKCDKNGDGKLSRNELQAAFKVLGSNCPFFVAIGELLLGDKNRDGFINKQEMEKLIDNVEKLRYVK
ncbi:hypothetical protein I3843_15G054400 [Carya illinoinensis]|uniref:EF-hand domain-containing protein n=1 Tax=Carya illinoinensis TaxID=32201 RepID=A0A922A994_CARIL|nr:hypothetical protein I3760_15G056700 [Carya illinoinensis]KAG6674701.1 hypothetical protein I3842_15G057400 [Carya illinoinensis]KAG7943676.1 hypothetical protein I3843_15G054400 [Carya illinoinensis]